MASLSKLGEPVLVLRFTTGRPISSIRSVFNCLGEPGLIPSSLRSWFIRPSPTAISCSQISLLIRTPRRSIVRKISIACISRLQRLGIGLLNFATILFDYLLYCFHYFSTHLFPYLFHDKDLVEISVTVYIVDESNDASPRKGKIK